ncbi:hypothetical protein L7F22_063463 [Adiantum nelumboides]|nr:hypothetical protein [Adiantum nelumboides]
MRSWLGWSASSSTVKDEVKEEIDEDEDLAGLDFRDEEPMVGQDREGSMKVEEDETEEEDEEETLGEDHQDEGAQECEDGTAPPEAINKGIEVKLEPQEDSLELDPQAGLFIDAKSKVPVTPKDEKPKDRSRILVVVGTYTIGKEKIVLACARALNTKIYCTDSRKYRVYAQLDDAELHSLLTRDPLRAAVHVTSLMTINGDALRDHVSAMRKLGARIDRAIAFRPTGWTYRPPPGADVVSPSLDRVIQWNQSRRFGSGNLFPTRDSTREYSIYGVPYSEHSSFFELSAFALSLDYVKIIATVNVGSANSRAKMARWFEKWKSEKKRREYKPVVPRDPDYF